MSKFELKGIEVEVLGALARECERSIDWYMEYDEAGNKVLPTDERNLAYIKAYQDMIVKLEKMI